MREFESVLHLNQEDAARFYNAYYYPDESLRIQNAQAYDRITSDVATRQTQNGFVGSIRGLDLSFLDSVERVMRDSAPTFIKVSSECEERPLACRRISGN